MSENSRNSSVKQTDDFLSGPPSARQKAWGIIHEFYHLLLTHMKKERISRADLARRLNRSRSAVSQLLNKTPNFTVEKMVELADAVGLDLSLVTLQEKAELRSRPKQRYIYVVLDTSIKGEERQEFPANPPFLEIENSMRLEGISCHDLSYTADPRNLH